MKRFSDLLGRDDAAASDDSSRPATGDVVAAPQLPPDDGPETMPVAPAPEHTLPQGGMGRDVFSELADEQAAYEDHETEAETRVRELGLAGLPAVQDDFLPGS